MREVTLTRGFVTLVDEEDYGRVVEMKWCAVRGTRTNYAVRNVDGKTVYLHRFLTGAKPGEDVDHRNHDGLDNRRANLRVCSRSNNCQNARLSKHNTSGFKGVSWDMTKGKWHAQIKLNGARRHLGLFSDPQEAALAYDAAARRLFGVFACTNASLGLLVDREAEVLL